MSAETFVEAIALSSPSGRMSKRARAAANKRLAAMWEADRAKADAEWRASPESQAAQAQQAEAAAASRKARLLGKAAELRRLADGATKHGSLYRKKAEDYERQAAEIA